uniref:Uncharacterized protein n=1 Tax=viral metagenome TaxID=1070528 RepID=A0A6C0H5R3_9ZZZZ
MDIIIGKYKIKLGVLLIILFLFWIMSGHLICGCSKIGMMEGFKLLSNMTKEGFSGAKNLSYIPDISYVNDPPINTKYWDNPANLPPPDISKFSDFQDPKYLLDHGELSIVAATKFSPNCCANLPAYSNSSGCACLNMDQFNYLRERGGNNKPYSEY